MCTCERARTQCHTRVHARTHTHTNTHSLSQVLKLVLPLSGTPQPAYVSLYESGSGDLTPVWVALAGQLLSAAGVGAQVRP